MDTNQPNLRPLLEHCSIKQQQRSLQLLRAGPNPVLYDTILFVELSSLAQTLAGEQPAAPSYSSRAREHPRTAIVIF